MNQLLSSRALFQEMHSAKPFRQHDGLAPAEKNILRNVPETLVAIDHDGTVVFANDTVRRTFGLTPSEVVGQEMTDLIMERFRGSYSCLVQQFIEGRSPMPRSFESRGLRANGSDFPIRIQLGSLRKGSEIYVLNLIQDLTEIETLKEQLWRSQELEPVALLARGVAHDLNNALGATSGFLEILLKSRNLEDDTRLMLQEASLATQYAAALTKQMTVFNQDAKAAARALDLNYIVSATVKILGGLLGKNVEVVTRLGPGLEHVKTDTCQMERVIINLAVNARDAMHGGGQIVIETANIHQERTELGLPSGDYVMLAVSDDGCGMDEKTRARIFEPLFTTKAPGKGTGLGLSTVAEIVKDNGGHIRVTSEPGHGTTFQLFLPRTLETEAVAARVDQQPTS